MAAGDAGQATPGKVRVAPYLRLEAHAHLANVVQCGEEGQPCCRGVVQGVQPSGAGQLPADCRLGQQRLETGANVSQVMLQQVDALGVAVARL